jgi:hypothetical protein
MTKRRRQAMIATQDKDREAANRKTRFRAALPAPFAEAR